MASTLHAEIRCLIQQIPCSDATAAEHRAAALDWLDETNDIFRRIKPRTPSPHLVSYCLLLDRSAGAVLLCDHRAAGLWLPAGGHVEPGEHPRTAAVREVGEELRVLDPVPDQDSDGRPFFLTMTETVGEPRDRHVDVTLWYAWAAQVNERLVWDAREFKEIRWWTVAELGEARLDRFEPHLMRALIALGLAR